MCFNVHHCPHTYSRCSWVVEDLHPGSAVATLRGIADDPEKVELVVNDYGDIGGLLERHEDLRYGRRVNQAAEAIRELAQTVEYVRLETAGDDYTIYGNGGVEKQKVTKSVGAITGRVQTLSNRGGLSSICTTLPMTKPSDVIWYKDKKNSCVKAWGRRARGAAGFPGKCLMGDRLPSARYLPSKYWKILLRDRIEMLEEQFLGTLQVGSPKILSVS